MREFMDTKKELKNIWNGMMYHCSELSRFMVEHGNDEFFKTEMGMKISAKAITITMAHLTGMLLFSENDGEKKPDVNFSELEDLLNDALKDD